MNYFNFNGTYFLFFTVRKKVDKLKYVTVCGYVAYFSMDYHLVYIARVGPGMAFEVFGK